MSNKPNVLFNPDQFRSGFFFSILKVILIASDEEKMMEKTFMGILRSTFAIDEKGIISHVFDKVNTAKHGKDVLRVL